MREIVSPAAVEGLLVLIPVIPFVGALVSGLFGPRMARSSVHLVAVGAIAVSFVISLGALIAVWSSEEGLAQVAYTWISVGTIDIEARFVVDRLSSIMLIVVTGVGLLIHVYSTGYMAHEPSYARYFAYLNLFVGSMLVLVLADSLPVLFVGWEGVGLCSYLLIGFWYTDTAKAKAGKKAFIVNRVGDFGFLLGMLVLFGLLGTFSISGMREATVGLTGDSVVPAGTFFGGWTWAAAMGLAFVLILVGCTGKSAQIPLFVWLPDAMAGPTPVSALIHAATMVTAGVYVLARLSFLLVLSPQVMALIAIVGALTALTAAFMALFQNGMKKVLAYSTISQLGFMFIGVGVGAFHAGVYHLFTHAFFKACLFLCAGSVMHALEKGAAALDRERGLLVDTEDIRLMGGLKRKMPHTHATFLLATLAITGIPPLAGFFSKDIILHAALTRDLGVSQYLPWALWAAGTGAAVLTAIYMWRLYFLVFRGAPRQEALFDGAHESPPAMLVPLWILAFFSAAAGVFGLFYMLGRPGSFSSWLSPVLAQDAVSVTSSVPASLPLVIAILVAFSGLGAAWVVWGRLELKGDELAKSRLGPIFRASYARLWWDEVYDLLVVRPTMAVSRILYWLVDVTLIDRVLVDGTARATMRVGRLVRPLQSGSVGAYAAALMIGAAVIVGVMMGVFVLGRAGA